MGAWYDPYIERAPGVQGGAPVLKGTRTPVHTVVQLSRDTYPDKPEEVRAALPHLHPTQIEAALAYHRDHSAEVEAEIRRHTIALEPFLQSA